MAKRTPVPHVPPYGEVLRERVPRHNVTIVVRKIWRQSGDLHHWRVLKGDGLEQDERKPGHVLARGDVPAESRERSPELAAAVSEARAWVRSDKGRGKIAKSFGRGG